ncbi:ligand-binding sensor domain-containing protein [Anditalea andensis]|uniref:Histidine kinase n=1 Tax=Anditalea andensis TaxID=1048983 RepID=A0A074KZ14_9BACT|nr:two-component regulator propeller domain-containing protein [Anditalea andensis]KEO75211.1 histidine kinase [Anditalea andensis]
MKTQLQIYTLLLIFAFCGSCKEEVKTELPKIITRTETREEIISNAPSNITRNLIQDKNGNIWIAAFDGIFRYGGISFTNITQNVSSARFFSVLEDRNRNFWFASVGSGVFYYNGKSFKNFTTKDGLGSDHVGTIYEDNSGHIWFGTGGGASRYDGEKFHNFTTNEGLPNNDISAIIEDKNGKFWFGSRDGVSYYDGQTFTDFKNDKDLPFVNTRSILEDKKGNIWLGGRDGLWRYDGSTFTYFTKKFVGYIYEDSKGNIWTSSDSENDKGWVLSRYDEKSLSNRMLLAPKKANVTEIMSEKWMIFGIVEDDHGNIWVGSDGVYKYDGKTIIHIKGKESQK